MDELTDDQLERQDYVDNEIFDLICRLNPSEGRIEWNIEMIGDVRDVISHCLVDRLSLCADEEFYP